MNKIQMNNRKAVYAALANLNNRYFVVGRLFFWIFFPFTTNKNTLAQMGVNE
ncbi:MAG: hypothetical protein FWE90_12820 [Defluviitaleaceae bacterium]|nr:hypothetical protein [Defluviitaleaceae bacterium]